MDDVYSQHWFETFLETKPISETHAEVDGLCRFLPRAEFPRILDVGCGPGRHAAEFTRRGYSVVGVDRDEISLAKARERVPSATFHRLDMRDLDSLTKSFDAVVSLWHSYGYFDAQTNDELLGAMARRVRAGGRLAFDLFHPRWHEQRVGRHEFPAHPGTSVEYRVEGGRVGMTISYADGSEDRLGWECIPPELLIQRASSHGLELLANCSFWDPDRAAGPDIPRYQCVFQRAAQ